MLREACGVGRQGGEHTYEAPESLQGLFLSSVAADNYTSHILVTLTLVDKRVYCILFSTRVTPGQARTTKGLVPSHLHTVPSPAGQ